MKARSVRHSASGFNSLGEAGHRDRMGCQGQSRAYTQRTSRGSALGTRAGSRLRLKHKLMERFTMTDMGDVPLVLSMQITRHREVVTLTIGQEHHTKSILTRFGVARCNPVHTTRSGAELSFDQSDDTLLDPTGTELYQSITRSLMIWSQCTR